MPCARVAECCGASLAPCRPLLPLITPGSLQATPLVGPTVGWASGVILDPEELAALRWQKRHSEELRNNPDVPLMYMDIAIQGKLVGRMEIVLYSDITPRTAENFRWEGCDVVMHA